MLVTRESLFVVKVGGPDENGCMPWLGYIRPDGYGDFGIGNHRTTLAHRWAYEHYVGQIQREDEEGRRLSLDHLCFNRACVNVDHLELVTQQENVQRGKDLLVACPSGHPYDEENTYRNPNTGHRACRTCNRLRARKES